MGLTQSELQHLLGSRYRLERELGGGSMATVYLAQDPRHGRQVAVKVLRQEYAATFAAERFLREIDIAARLQHPHIVPLLDSGEVGGNLYLVMPFVEGESLRARLAREGRLAAGEVIRILADVTDALAYAHGKGIIHRDIKPDNILLSGRHALVTDFGVAKAIAESNRPERTPGTRGSSPLTIGVALGTPAYMAPEQATASPELDHRVDLYALGVVAYELLTGAPPFEGPTAQAILTAHVLDPPVPLAERRPDVPPALAAIVDRCLAKRADDRWQSAAELLHQLEPLATPSGGTTPASVAPVPGRSRGMHAVLMVVMVLAALAAAAALTRREPAIGMAGTQRQVTFTGQVNDAAISPDGELLAFVAESGGRNRLMVQDLRGGQAIELSVSQRFDYPSWSADGSEVRCFSLDSAGRFLRRVPRLGGAPRDLRVFLWSTLSPAGDRLATLRQATGRFTIRTPATGDSVSAPGEAGWWYSLPTWSRDGERVAWASLRQSDQGARLWVSSARQPNPTVLLEDSLGLGAPGWDGDGKALYYFRTKGRLVDLMRISLGRNGAAAPPEIIRAGLTVGRVGSFQAFHAPPSLSADGSRLVYTDRQEWSNLAVADLEQWRLGKPPRMLTTGSAAYEAARLSPDEQAIAAERTESEGLSVQLLPLQGGAPKELGRLRTSGGLAWSRRGDRVVAAAVDGDRGRGLVTFPVDGGPPRTIAHGAVSDEPEWFGDSAILVGRPDNRSLQVVETASGRGSPLPGLEPIGWMFSPRISPDGRRIAFAWNKGDGRHGVYVMSLDDSTIVQLYDGFMNPVRWSRDGGQVFLVDAGIYADSSRLYAVAADGGRRSLLGVFPPGMEVADVTNDGRRAILIIHERRGDAWMIRFPAGRR